MCFASASLTDKNERFSAVNTCFNVFPQARTALLTSSIFALKVCQEVTVMPWNRGGISSEKCCARNLCREHSGQDEKWNVQESSTQYERYLPCREHSSHRTSNRESVVVVDFCGVSCAEARIALMRPIICESACIFCTNQP